MHTTQPTIGNCRSAAAIAAVALLCAGTASAQNNSTVGVMSGDLPGSFMVPGTSTSIKFGGLVRVDAVKDFDGGMGGSLGVVPLIPLDGSAQSTRSGQFTLTARASRFVVEASTPTRHGPARAYLEADFYGAGGNELATTSAGLRARQMYAQIGSLVLGQTYSTFTDLFTQPEVVDFGGPHGVPAPNRIPLVRYSTLLGGNEFAIAIENPEGGDISGTGATTMVAGAGPTNATYVDTMPDIVARFTVPGQSFRLSLMGVGRRLTFNNIGGTAVNGFVGESSTTAGGIGLGLRWKTGATDSLTLNGAYGTGLSRYVLVGIPGTTAVIENGRLKAIPSGAVNIGYQHFWSSTVRSSLVYGLVRNGNPHPALPVTTLNRAESLTLNLLWEPFEKATAGIELVRGRVKNEAVATPTLSNEGSNTRLGLTLMYRI